MPFHRGFTSRSQWHVDVKDKFEIVIKRAWVEILSSQLCFRDPASSAWSKLQSPSAGICNSSHPESQTVPTLALEFSIIPAFLDFWFSCFLPCFAYGASGMQMFTWASTNEKCRLKYRERMESTHTHTPKTPERKESWPLGILFCFAQGHPMSFTAEFGSEFKSPPVLI